MWEMLVRDGKGKVKVDVDIGGRLLHPEIPIGPVLAAQLGTAGRKAATGVLSIVPIGIVQDIGESWEKNVEDQARYDDVLKIARLDPKEQHFERARHYEKVVKSYKMAVEEYTAQVREYPKEADLAVRSLAMMAEIQARQLKDPPGAIATLRRLVEAYASHPDADDAMLRMIDISAESKDYSNADKLCTEFGEKFQGSGLAESVAERRRRIAKYVW
jgi:TolA-binding protein